MKDMILLNNIRKEFKCDNIDNALVICINDANFLHRFSRLLFTNGYINRVYYDYGDYLYDIYGYVYMYITTTNFNFSGCVDIDLYKEAIGGKQDKLIDIVDRLGNKDLLSDIREELGCKKSNMIFYIKTHDIYYKFINMLFIGGYVTNGRYIHGILNYDKDKNNIICIIGSNAYVRSGRYEYFNGISYKQSELLSVLDKICKVEEIDVL